MVNKKIIIILISVLAVLIIASAAAGFFYFKNLKTSAKPDFGNIFEKLNNGIPSIQTNVLENKPDLNPINKANPIKEVKTNPFE